MCGHKGLDERRERRRVDGMRDKGVAECRGGHVERDGARRGNLHRNGHGGLEGELELLAGWAGLWLLLLLLLLLLWLLCGMCMRV